jgi:hypothetical protein
MFKQKMFHREGTDLSDCSTSFAPFVLLKSPIEFASLVTPGSYLLVPGKIHFVLPNHTISFHCESKGIS